MFDWIKNLFKSNKKCKYWNLDFSFMKTDKNGRRCDNNYPSHILGGFKNTTPLVGWGSCNEEDFKELIRLFIEHPAFNKIDNKTKKELVITAAVDIIIKPVELSKGCTSPDGIVTGEPPKTK